MGKVIEFPNQEARQERELEQIIDSIEFPTEELCNCVKQNVTPILLKYNQLPKHSFSIELPVTQSTAEVDNFVTKIQEEVKKYASQIQLEMMTEIINLYVALCKCELKNK